MTGTVDLQNYENVVRLPLYDGESNRAFSGQGQGAAAQDQQLFNCFAALEKSAVDNSRDVQVMKRPGTLHVNGIDLTGIVNSTTDIYPRALCTMTQLNHITVSAFFDSSVNKIYIVSCVDDSSAPVKIGEIAGANKGDIVHLSELSIAGVCNLGVVWIAYDKNLSKGFYAASTGTGAKLQGNFVAGGLTEITDADFPTQLGTPDILTGPMVQMNGTTYVMGTTGAIYNSDLNSISSWNALGVIQAIAYPDKGVGLCRYKHHLVAFGMDSIEFFNDVGIAAPASPLQRTDEAFIKFGCASQKAFINIDDTLYWLAASTTSTSGLWKLEGYTPVKISTNRIDQRIADSYKLWDSAVENRVFLQTIIVGGFKHLVLNGLLSYCGLLYGTFSSDADDPYPTSILNYRSTITLCNLDNITWWSWTDELNTEVMHITSVFESTNYKWRQFILRDITETIPGGHVSKCFKFFYIDGTGEWNYFFDHDVNVAVHPIPMGIQLNPQDFGNEHRKFVQRATLISDYLDHPSGDSGANAKLYLLFNRKEYSVGVGDTIKRSITIPNTFYRYYWNNLGQMRKANFALASLNTMPFRGKALELIVAQGTG